MKTNKIFVKTAWILLAAAMLTSCKIREEYQRPENIAPENLYRLDRPAASSSSVGEVSWREFFTDVILQKHIEQALTNNLDIRIALQNIVAAETYLKQAKAAYQPTLSAGPNYTFSSPSLNTVTGQLQNGARRYINQPDFGLSASWEADIWGKLKAQEKAQLAAFYGSEAAHRSVTSTMVTTLATSYYQLLMLDAQRKSLIETIAIREKNLETTKALKVAGTLTEVAVQQSQALVYNAKSQVVSIDNEIFQLENTIALLKGMEPSAVERSTLDQQNFTVPEGTGYPVALLANRPDVMQAEYALIQNHELTNAARAQFYPTLSITAGLGLQSTALDRFFSASSIFGSVMAGLAQPILNRRTIRTNYEVSLANREISLLNFKKALLTAGQEVSDALRSYHTQDEFINYKQQELLAYQKSAEYSQELVNYGMANYLEVLNADVNRLNAELNIAGAKFNKLQSGVELYRALGGGWR